MLDRSLTARWILLVAWLVLVASVTLTPTARPPSLTLASFLCISCGWGDTADIIRNWALFVPIGTLGAGLLGARRAVAWAAVLTIAVETAQLWVPGRDPALRDLIFNALGAVSGAVLVRRGPQRVGQSIIVALAALGWLAPTLLLVPVTTDRDLYGQWTPRLAGTEDYGGRVLAAAIGAVPVRSGRLMNRAAVDSAVLDRRVVRLIVLAGAAPVGYAPVFQLVDADRVGLMSIGVLGEDLILRGGNRAEVWRLEQPDARWSGGMRSVAAGDTVAMVVDRGRGSICMSVGSRSSCGLAPSLGDGWSHLLHIQTLPGPARASLSLLWSLCLGAAVGAALRSVRVASVMTTALAAIGIVAATLSPDVTADTAQSLMLIAGGPLGAWLRPALRTAGSVVLAPGRAED